MLNISDFLLKVIPWSLCEVSDFLTSSMVTFQDTETRNSKKKIKKNMKGTMKSLIQNLLFYEFNPETTGMLS